MSVGRLRISFMRREDIVRVRNFSLNYFMKRLKLKRSGLERTWMGRTSNSRKEEISSVRSRTSTTMYRISRLSGLELGVQKCPGPTWHFKTIVFIRCRMTEVEGHVSRVLPSQARVLLKLSRVYVLCPPITVV